MKRVLFYVSCLLCLLVPGRLRSQEAAALQQARAVYLSFTNGLVGCGIRFRPTDAENIQVQSRKSEPLRFFVGTSSYEINFDHSPLLPFVHLTNLESQDWLRRVAASRASGDYKFKLTAKQAEESAKGFARQIGPEISEAYRFSPVEWPMSTSNQSADSAKRSWGFTWHRHLGDLPVFGETIQIRIDDESGAFAGYSNFVRPEHYSLVDHPVQKNAEARKRIEQTIHKGYALDAAKPEKGYLHHIGGPFLVVVSPRLLTPELVQRLGKTADGKQRVRLAWAYHFWISPNGKPSEERIKKLNSAEAARGLFDAETFEIIPL